MVAGQARVGSTLSVATAPVWTPVDAATTYRWLRDGAPIPDLDAADGEYTVTAADLGADVAVQATGTKEGHTDGQATSSSVGPVALGTMQVVQPPAIEGLARVGQTLSANGPEWSPANATTSYQWRRNGAPVGGNSTTYALKAADVGQRISVRATGTAAGYQAGVADSAATATVTKLPATVTPRGSSTKVGALRLAIHVTAPGETVTGTVSVRQGTKLLKSGLRLSGGRVTYIKSGIKPGRYTYSVRYAGSARVAVGTGSISVAIKAKTKPSIRLTPTTEVGKVKIRISVTAPGQPPLGGTAYVKKGSKTVKAKIKIVKGRATFTATKVKSGRHTYTVGHRGTSQVRSGSVTVTVKVPAPVKLVSYASCAALRKVHPHGVGRKGATDSTTGKPVTTFLVNTKLYEYNDGKNDKPGEKDLDRDNDGIACEQH